MSDFPELPLKNFLQINDLVTSGLFLSADRVRRADLPSIRLNSKSVVYRRTDVVLWLNERTSTPKQRKHKNASVDIAEVLS